MRALLAILQPKTITKIGRWHQNDKMPCAAFPLSKSHNYVLGRGWDWCVCELRGPRQEGYKLLVAFDAAKEQYRAWLGLVSGSDLAVVARLEYHPSHHSWHIHTKRGPLAEVARGVVKDHRQRDRSRLCRTQNSFTVTQLDAFTIAFKAFNVSRPEPLSLSE